MASTKESTRGQTLSATFRAAAGLSARKSDGPATNVENGDKGYKASELTNVSGPEGGYGGDEDRTMGVNQPYERRPSEDEVTVVEGPPNPPEGKAHNMSSGQWSSDASVSPVNTDDPVEGVKSKLETPVPKDKPAKKAAAKKTTAKKTATSKAKS